MTGTRGASEVLTATKDIYEGHRPGRINHRIEMNLPRALDSQE